MSENGQPDQLRVYEVTYRGVFNLGGVAIVLARDERHAEELVKEHTTTHNFTEVAVEPLAVSPDGCVLWNWNGGEDARVHT